MRNISLRPATQFIIFCTCLLSLVSAEARAQRRQQARIQVSSIGTGTDTDRETARSQAKDSAESGLICLGQLDGVRSSVSCGKLGDGDDAQWLCTANATGVCIMGG